MLKMIWFKNDKGQLVPKWTVVPSAPPPSYLLEPVSENVPLRAQQLIPSAEDANAMEAKTADDYSCPSFLYELGTTTI